MSQNGFPQIRNGTQIGRFTLGQRLSTAGNFAQIYLAKIMENHRRVALKIARGGANVYKNSLQAEALMLANLRHPGIVRIVPINVEGVRVFLGKAVELRPYFNHEAPWYYAMEILHGGSLESNMKNGLIQSMTAEWKVELVYQIAVILDYLHGSQIAHHDLKPENIVFRSRPHPDVTPDPVLVDFGIAQARDGRPLHKAGSLAYMSPERVEYTRGVRAQFRTTKSDKWDWLPSDVWALGVIAHEIFTGRHPYEPFTTTDQLATDILSGYIQSPDIEPSLERTLLGVLPQGRRENHERANGLLSFIRELRPDMPEVLRLLDTENPYPPPRIKN